MHPFGSCPCGRGLMTVSSGDRAAQSGHRARQCRLMRKRERARSGPRVKVLTQLPGVGPFTALVILAEIGDITRFPTARKLASWAGLTPTVRGSDRTVRHGHISKQGPTWVRWVACEAAARQHPPAQTRGVTAV